VSRVVVALGALTKSVGASPELMRKLARAGLVRPIGKDDKGRLWVDAEARRQVERVQTLMAAGYAERDIALVIGKVAAAGERVRVDEVCDLEAFAGLVEVPSETVGAWVEASLMPVWGTREDGAPMFLSAAVELGRLFAAAEALDLGAHKALLARVVRGEGRAAGEDIAAFGRFMGERLERLERAVKILRKILPKLETPERAPRERRLLARRKKATTRLVPKR
jgi:hypothetical protein